MNTSKLNNERSVKVWPCSKIFMQEPLSLHSSERSSEKPHDAQIGLSSGEILTAHCTMFTLDIANSPIQMTIYVHLVCKTHTVCAHKCNLPF